MIANPALIELATSPAACLLAAVKIGLGLALISRAIIAPGALWLRAGMTAAGLVVIFAPPPF
jgi:hypothetical protein